MANKIQDFLATHIHTSTTYNPIFNLHRRHTPLRPFHNPRIDALHLHPGDTLQISGRSGTGKTELLYHLVSVGLVPRVWRGVEIGGHEARVVIFDVDGGFMVDRLATYMVDWISRCFQLRSDIQSDTSSDNVKDDDGRGVGQTSGGGSRFSDDTASPAQFENASGTHQFNQGPSPHHRDTTTSHTAPLPATKLSRNSTVPILTLAEIVFLVESLLSRLLVVHPESSSQVLLGLLGLPMYLDSEESCISDFGTGRFEMVVIDSLSSSVWIDGVGTGAGSGSGGGGGGGSSSGQWKKSVAEGLQGQVQKAAHRVQERFGAVVVCTDTGGSGSRGWDSSKYVWPGSKRIVL